MPSGTLSPWLGGAGPSTWNWRNSGQYNPSENNFKRMSGIISSMFGGGGGFAAGGSHPWNQGAGGDYPMPNMEGMDEHSKTLAQAKYLHNMRNQWGQNQNQTLGPSMQTANVETGISADPVYSDNAVQKMKNQIRAGYDVDPNFASQQFAAPGQGTSSATMSAAMPGLIQGRMGAEGGVQNAVLGARQANENNILQGQNLQSQMGLGMAGGQLQQLLNQMGYDRGMEGVGLGYDRLGQQGKGAMLQSLMQMLGM